MSAISFFLVMSAMLSADFVSSSASLPPSKDKWLGKTDPNSFSNPEDILTETIHIKWIVDFHRKVVKGSVTLSLKVLNPNLKELILDTRDIEVSQIMLEDGQDLAFGKGKTVSTFGEPLSIQIPDLFKTGNGSVLTIKIVYSTSPNCTALQWLDPIQTVGKQHPYVFSQCECIHARSLLPCQDTPSVKATYTAEVIVPRELRALMSAVPDGGPENSGVNKVYRFNQNIPIPSYLIALVVGDIVGKEIGPRSRVWAEKEVVDAAAFEFSETESMLKAAENLLGTYVWGQYDILVLPPSFPFGGMENPCLTFVTPTILVGDKSLAYVIVHEIAHRQFVHINGWIELDEEVNRLKKDNPLTRLVRDLNGIDPDEAFNRVPYEKGAEFLYFLEQKVGGPKEFEQFLRYYIESNLKKSVDSTEFKAKFLAYFGDRGVGHKVEDVDWNTWLHGEGMPPVKNKYEHSLLDQVTALKARWIQWNSSMPNTTFNKSDLDTMFPVQIQLFLQILLKGEALPLDKVEAMNNIYHMKSRKNPEIRSRWIRLCIRARSKDVLPIAFKFVNEIGRMRLIRPIYRDLYEWEEIRPQVIENYEENSKYMMHIVATMIREDLHLD